MASEHFAPPGWPLVVPRLVAPDPRGLVEFIRVTFGASGDYREAVPTELHIGGSVVMISGTGERGAMTGFLYVYVPDTDAAFQRAVAGGAAVIEAPAEMPYGDRRAMVRDPWGNTWQIATHRGFVAPS
jgi:PhnB protein